MSAQTGPTKPAGSVQGWGQAPQGSMNATSYKERGRGGGLSPQRLSMNFTAGEPPLCIHQLLFQLANIPEFY